MAFPNMEAETPQEDMAEGGQEEGISVTIDKTASGFTVSSNPGEPQPAESLDEALQMAAQMLQGGQQGPEQGQQPGGQSMEDQAMAAGFNQVRGKGLNG